MTQVPFFAERSESNTLYNKAPTGHPFYVGRRREVGAAPLPKRLPGAEGPPEG